MNKLFNKNEALCEKNEVFSGQTDNIDIPKNSIKTGNFITNTYEINSLQNKIENGSIELKELPLEVKLKIIEEYDKQIKNLQMQINEYTRKV